MSNFDPYCLSVHHYKFSLAHALLNAIWAGGFAFKMTFDADFHDPIHWNSKRFGGPFVLFILYGFSDSVYQTYLYWLMGAMSNDPALLARYAGFYKAMQSAGAAAAFGIDASSIRLRWECLICWILVFISFPLIFLVANKVIDTNVTEENLLIISGDISNEEISQAYAADEKKFADNLQQEA